MPLSLRKVFPSPPHNISYLDERDWIEQSSPVGIEDGPCPIPGQLPWAIQ
ncbi:MAG: hypothetical protein LZF60_90080 [Nitrospira sp.]|nr:MAG: hypothetical protein LZF60_90080 [Nitrospira sp.]